MSGRNGSSHPPEYGELEDELTIQIKIQQIQRKPAQSLYDGGEILIPSSTSDYFGRALQFICNKFILLCDTEEQQKLVEGLIGTLDQDNLPVIAEKFGFMVLRMDPIKLRQFKAAAEKGADKSPAELIVEDVKKEMKSVDDGWD